MNVIMYVYRQSAMRIWEKEKVVLDGEVRKSSVLKRAFEFSCSNGKPLKT